MDDKLFLSSMSFINNIIFLPSFITDLISFLNGAIAMKLHKKVSKYKQKFKEIFKSKTETDKLRKLSEYEIEKR